MREQASDHLTILEKEVRTGPLGEAALDKWKKWEKEWTTRAAKQKHGKSQAVLAKEPKSPYEIKEEARKIDTTVTIAKKIGIIHNSRSFAMRG